MTDRMDTCSTCRFYQAFPDMVGQGEGQCRKGAPYAVIIEKQARTMWPAVLVSDWCGEYQPRRG